jgi:ferritin-like protein
MGGSSDTQRAARTFVEALVGEMEDLFTRLGEQEILEAETEGRLEVVPLLKLAMASELEASELAGYWMPGTRELDAKMLFAEQCGDEMKHYRLIARRLEELGESLDDFDALADGYSPLYQYQKGLRTTIERVASGVFASEAIAAVRNRQFMELCRRTGDEGTYQLYATRIAPEEVHHRDLGRAFLERHATTPELRELATAATRNTLAIADELRTLTQKATGLGPIPLS